MESNTRHTSTALECIFAYSGHRIANSDAWQARTLVECSLADAGHFITNYDFLDICKSAKPRADFLTMESNNCQARAAVKRLGIYCGNGVRDGHTC